MIVTGCLVTITFFQNGALPYIAIMNEDIGKFVYDSMQQRTKKKKHENDLTKNLVEVKFLTCHVSFVLLRSSCLRHDVNNRVKCNTKFTA